MSSVPQSDESVAYRGVTYRLIPGTKRNAEKLWAISGACRFVWNHFLAKNKEEFRLYRMAQWLGWREEWGPEPKSPPTSFYSLSPQFTKLRKTTPWMQGLPANVIRGALRDYQESWQRAFKHGGFPKFKSRYKGTPGFRIDLDSGKIRIADNKLYVPKVGWVVVRRRRGNPYSEGPPVTVRINNICGKWYAHVIYKVEGIEPEDNGLSVGVDMNVGQVAASTGHIFHMPDLAKKEARRKRYARKMARQKKTSNRRKVTKARLAKVSRQIANARKSWHHFVSKTLTDTAGTVVVEDLNTQGMTRSAKGTEDAPGTNVRQKAGLNRSILNTGWSQLRTMLEYKAANLVKVNAAYTSQTCNSCGTIDKTSRKSQSVFECAHCGHEDNADVNAALNILALEPGASGRRKAWALAPFMTRQYHVRAEERLCLVSAT